LLLAGLYDIIGFDKNSNHKTLVEGKYMLKKLMAAIIATVSLTVGMALGQESSDNGSKYSDMLYAEFGRNIISIKELNSRLEKNGYSRIPENFISIGGGLYTLVNGFMLGGEGYKLYGSDAGNDISKTSIDATYGFFNIGHILYSNSKFRVYPIFSIGGGRLNLKLIEKSSLTFDTVLGGAKRSTKLSTGGLLLDVSLKADYLLLELKKETKKPTGITIGLRLGYVFDPSKDDWTMDGLDLSDSPKTGITGPYIRFVIGTRRID